MAVKKDSTRLKAMAYYIENPDATQKEIAELYRVTEKTISGWIQKYDWESSRWDFHASPTFIKQKLQQEAIRIINGEKASFSADSISKIMSAIDKLDRQADPIIVHKILKDLDNFISELEPKFALKCTEYHKMFLQHRIKLEG